MCGWHVGPICICLHSEWRDVLYFLRPQPVLTSNDCWLGPMTQNPNSYPMLRAYCVPDTLLGTLHVITISPPSSTKGPLLRSHLEEAAQRSEVLALSPGWHVTGHLLFYHHALSFCVDTSVPIYEMTNKRKSAQCIVGVSTTSWVAYWNCVPCLI